MEIRDGLELSPRKAAYIRFIHEKGGQVRTSEVATRFCIDPSTVTKTVSELVESGLLTHTPYYGVRLSDAGRAYAGFLVKRHRILSLVFTHYGLSDEEACEEVSRFESLVSKAAIDRMCKTMGHPRQGVCGEITHDTGCMGHAR